MIQSDIKNTDKHCTTTIFCAFLLLFTFPCFGQNGNAVNRYGVPNDSTCRTIDLPRLWRSDFTSIYEVGKKSSYQYIVSDNAAYYKIFARYPKDSLPVINFVTRELVVRIACYFCARGGGTDNEPRHRNACSYQDFWCLRKKTKTLVISAVQ